MVSLIGSLVYFATFHIINKIFCFLTGLHLYASSISSNLFILTQNSSIKIITFMKFQRWMEHDLLMIYEVKECTRGKEKKLKKKS